MSLTKDDVLKKLILRASDGLVLQVYARMQADRFPRNGSHSGSDPVKSWIDLVLEAVREGAVTIEEGAILLYESDPWNRWS
jgi:hypothetical protein